MTNKYRAGDSQVDKLIVLGLGLLGASICAAAKKLGLANEIIGISRRQSTIEIAHAKEIIDKSSDSLATLAGNFGEDDLLVLAVPTLAMKSVLSECQEHVPPSVTITDVASVKTKIIEFAEQVNGDIPKNFVPGHPIAGSEKSGINAANPDLFKNHKVVLTPKEMTSKGHINKVSEIWTRLGADVTFMNADDHDRIFAATSHLPHYLAYSLVDTLSRESNANEIFDHAAGGFKDFTRIAGSDPIMWHDIALTNSQFILEIMDRYIADITKLRDAIEKKDSRYLVDTFNRSRLFKTKKTYRNDRGIDFISKPCGELRGEITVPGDKSVSHRSIIFGSLAQGTSEITGFLEGEDSLATLNAFREMGVLIEGPEDGRLIIHGVGLHGLTEPARELDLGNSGTSMRLMTGLLSAQEFKSRLVGDESLSSRPMRRVTVPLLEMGADIRTTADGTPPVEVIGGRLLKPIKYTLPIASAQLKSSLILAAMYADGESVIIEPVITRDHTERMMTAFGCNISVDDSSRSIKIQGGYQHIGTRIDIPGDISSAAFFMVAAAICPGSEINLLNIGINPTRIGVINILKEMGADIEITNRQDELCEPTANIRVRYSSLKGIEIPENQVSLAIDEFPRIFVAAACARGDTILWGAEELKVKESDRIESMAKGLKILGIETDVFDDGIKIIGGKIGSGTVNSNHDHRIAMAFSVAGLRSSGAITIQNCKNIATSFPNFVDIARSVGMKIDLESN